MKKSLLALAALTAFAGAASAQSTVTLFGGIDLGIKQIKNNATRTVMQQDGIYSSRLGFRTVEDLGGGLRAAVWIEGGMNPDVGTSAGQSWQRRQTVALLGSFGEIRLGRDYVPDFWNHTVFDPFGTNGAGSSVNAFGTFNGASTLVRANNSIGYFLPGGLGGLYGQAMYGLGEGTGDKHMAFRLGFQNGPINVAFANGNTETVAGAEWKRTNVGGSFAMGALTLMAQWNQGKASGGADHGRKQTLWGLGGAYAMGATTVKASYFSSDSSGTGVATRDATQMAFGFVHALSKRTDIYGTYSRVNNDAGASYTAGGGGTALTAGRDSSAFEVGVKATF